jgi:hypothetical protein
MKKAINDGIDAALKNAVPFALILQALESRAADFRRVEENRAEARRANPLPQMYDAETMQPIDSYGQARRAEAERTARELREQQRQYAADVDRRGREDAARR